MVIIRHEDNMDAPAREALLDRAFGRRRRLKTSERLREARVVGVHHLLLHGERLPEVDERVVVVALGPEQEPEPGVVHWPHALLEADPRRVKRLRLRNLRRLEEMEIRREYDGLAAERAELMALLEDEGRRWQAIGADVLPMLERLAADSDAARQLGGHLQMLGRLPADCRRPNPRRRRGAEVPESLLDTVYFRRS